MPNLKSGFKRMKTSEISRQKNVAARSRIKTTRKKFEKAVTEKNKAEGAKLFSALCSVLDKSVKFGTITRNTANRRKSRAAKKLSSLA